MRHSYSEVASKNVANPATMLLTSVNLLDHARLGEHAGTIRKAVYGVLGEGKVKTKDLGGHASTRQFTVAVVQKLGNQLSTILCGINLNLRIMHDTGVSSFIPYFVENH